MYNLVFEFVFFFVINFKIVGVGEVTKFCAIVFLTHEQNAESIMKEKVKDQLTFIR